MKAKEIDLYVWLQVNPTNKYVYQVSLIINNDSKFVDAIKQFVADMKNQRCEQYGQRTFNRLAAGIKF
ncbi:MAG: hypothetical protein ACQR33_01330 [Candidatus Saccharibacteria bacterium]